MIHFILCTSLGWWSKMMLISWDDPTTNQETIDILCWILLAKHLEDTESDDRVSPPAPRAINCKGKILRYPKHPLFCASESGVGLVLDPGICITHTHIFLYIHAYLHTHIYIYICMYVCMYVCMDGWMDGWMYVCMYVCMYGHVYIPARTAKKWCKEDKEVHVFTYKL